MNRGSNQRIYLAEKQIELKAKEIIKKILYLQTFMKILNKLVIFMPKIIIIKFNSYLLYVDKILILEILLFRNKLKKTIN